MKEQEIMDEYDYYYFGELFEKENEDGDEDTQSFT